MLKGDDSASEIEKLQQLLEEIQDQIQSVRNDLRDRSDRVDQLEANVRIVEKRIEKLRAEDTGAGEDRKREEQDTDQPSSSERLAAEREQEEKKKTEVEEEKGEQQLESEIEETRVREADEEATSKTEREAEEPVDDVADDVEREEKEAEETEKPPSEEEKKESWSKTSTETSTPVHAAEKQEEAVSSTSETVAERTAGSAGTADTAGTGEADEKSPLVKLEEYLTGYGYLVIGVIAMLFSAGFMLKLAYEREWLSAIMTDTHKIVAGTVLGALLIGAGEYLVRMKRSFFARGIFGLALGWLYFIFYIGFHNFEVFSQNMAGGYMIAVTATGVVLSIRHQSRLIAQLSFIGGFLTPWFISTGSSSIVPLFLYVTGLIVGFLVLSIWMQWPGLDVTAQIGTFSIFISWFVKYYSVDEFRVAIVFFWIFYGVLLASNFIKYRGWLAAEAAESEDEDAAEAPFLLSGPYCYLPIVGFVLLLLIYRESAGLFVPGAGMSLSVLGASYFLASSFLSRGRVRNMRTLQYLIGLGIFTIALLLLLLNNAYPVWVVPLFLGSLYAGYHAIRLWQSESYYRNLIPRGAISMMIYVVFFSWFLLDPPGSDLLLPLLSFTALFLLDHLTASYRFLFRGESFSFPFHYGSSCLLFLGGGVLLLSGVVPATPADIREYFPWFCYGFSGFFLLEHSLLIRDRNRQARYLVQSFLMLSLMIAPVFQTYELQHSWTNILPVSGLFFLGYEALLFQLDTERDWLIGGTAFLVISYFLFRKDPATLNIWALQTYGWILFLSFLRIPHLTMSRDPDAIDLREHIATWLLVTGFFFVLQMLPGEHMAVARYSSWSLVYLSLALGYQLLFSGVRRFFHSYTALGLLLGGFAHLHLLFKPSVGTEESWALLFPFLILILFTGENQEENEVRAYGTARGLLPLPRTVFLYAVPLFAYSLFFTDLHFHHNPTLAGGEAGTYFQHPIVHEVMLTFVTMLVAAGPIWKKIRRGQNIRHHGIALFQISLVLFYVASFFVADELRNVRDWFIPVVLAPVMFGAAYTMSDRWFNDQKQKLLYLINGFLMTTHGIMIAFNHQYQTLFLGLDAVVFFTLARIFRWKWILRGSALVVAWLGVHLCWSSYVIQAGRPGEGLTSEFIIRSAGVLVLIVLPYAARKFPWAEEGEFSVPIGSLVFMIVALLALYLGNLKLISYFGWYENEIREHMNAFMYGMSALWGGAGLVYYLSGFLLNYRILRLFGSLLILITTVKVFFFDLNVEMIWRVLSFFTLGCLLLLINYVYRSYIKPGDEG